MDDPISLLAKHNRKSIQAVVEEILDGGSVRVFLLPSFEYVTVMLSGIQVQIKMLKRFKVLSTFLSTHAVIILIPF